MLVIKKRSSFLKKVCLLLLFVCFVSSLVGYAPSLFRYPKKKYFEVGGDLSLVSTDDLNSRTLTFFQGRLFSNYYFFTEKTEFSISSVNNFLYSYQKVTVPTSADFENHEITGNTDLSLKKYLQKDIDVFILSRVGASYRDTFVNSSDYLSGIMSAGIGYGKVRNLNDYHRAIRVINLLKKGQQMSIEVSESIVQELAQLISRKNEYEKKFQNKTHRYSGEQFWRKLFYRDMKNILVKIPGIQNHLNYFMMKKIEEVIDQYIPGRSIGFLISYSPGLALSYSGDTKNWADYLSHGFSVKFAIPVSYRLGISMYGSLNIADYAPITTLTGYFRLESSYELSHDLYLTGEYLLNLVRFAGSDIQYSHSASLGVSMVLTKNILLEYNLRFQYSHGNGMQERRELYNSLKLGWRFF